MKLYNELGIRKCCKNCKKQEVCKDGKLIHECQSNLFKNFRPSENSLIVRCGELILERDKAVFRLRESKVLLDTLGRAHTKRNKECRKLWGRVKGNV